MLFRDYMPIALQEAYKAADLGEVPVGAVIVHPERGIIASTSNRTYTDKDPTAHAEILALRAAAMALDEPFLHGCDLYITLEPCAMCAQAIAWSKIRRLYYSVSDPKSGGVEHGAKVFAHSHHKPEIYSGFMSEASSALLQTFFANLRS